MAIWLCDIKEFVNTQVNPTMIIVNNWRMDPSLSALIHCQTGETRRLGEYHFILLETLAKNADTVLSRSFLMTEVWKNRIVGGNSLPTAIHALRVAIDDDGKQQEIIKTIPKKGYLFKKSYLVIDTSNPEAKEEEKSEDEEVNSEDIVAGLDETSTESAHYAQRTTEQWPVFTAIEEPSQRQKPRNSIIKKQHKIQRITLLVIISALFLSVLIYALTTTSEHEMVAAPLLIKEQAEHTDNITIYHLYNGDTHDKLPSQVSPHLRPGMEALSPLLASHHAQMTLYYKEGIGKVVFDIILSNQCNKSWQLVLNFKNWLNKDSEINPILFHEVEEMLNEIPKCA